MASLFFFGLEDSHAIRSMSFEAPYICNVMDPHLQQERRRRPISAFPSSHIPPTAQNKASPAGQFELAGMSDTLSTAEPNPGGNVQLQLKEQWANPGDIFSVLLIVGADVIQKALAQLSTKSFKPVAFSFGWVAYAYWSLLQTTGRLRTMPEPDLPSVLVDCGSGVVLERSSWILGRILHNYTHWMPSQVKQIKQHGGLCVTVFSSDLCEPVTDRLVWLGVLVTVVQLGIAAIPCALYREWEILLLTACGTLLAWLMGLLQDRTDSVRKGKTRTCALTKGRGSTDVIVILASEHSLRLEDFASSEMAKDESFVGTVVLSSLMTTLWTVLLITAAGIKSNTWYLLAIEAIRMLQNIYVAAASRLPDAYGIHLQFKRCIWERRVMDTLMEVEIYYSGVGKSLLPIFIPGPLRESERRWWEERDETSKRRETEQSAWGLYFGDCDKNEVSLAHYTPLTRARAAPGHSRRTNLKLARLQVELRSQQFVRSGITGTMLGPDDLCNEPRLARCDRRFVAGAITSVAPCLVSQAGKIRDNSEQGSDSQVHQQSAITLKNVPQGIIRKSHVVLCQRFWLSPSFPRAYPPNALSFFRAQGKYSVGVVVDEYVRQVICGLSG
ncbi:hypothetical protein AUP68_07661 [Ilyonectria robusta]